MWLGFAGKRGIPAIKVWANSSEGVRIVRQHGIDLLVYLGGGGILREAILAAPTLGVLNAHMGLLPAYRGMNVTEWALWNDDPVGCTVHLIVRGIDTGEIISTRRVDVMG